MLLTLNAAVHGGISTGANLIYSGRLQMSLPIEASIGYRFFLKNGNGKCFIDPVWTYSTLYFIKVLRNSEWCVPFKSGNMAAMEVRLGSVINNSSSVYVLLPKVELQYYAGHPYMALTIGTGAGAEWGVLPCVSLTAKAEVAARIKDAAFNRKMGLEANVKVGVEFHSSNYYAG